MTMAFAVTSLPATFLALSQTEARPIDAVEIAASYEKSVEAYWRGETKTVEFAAWLAKFWDPTVSFVVTRPAAISVYGCGGRGVRWHETRDAIVGVTPGVPGGYRIPVTARPPSSTTTNSANRADAKSTPLASASVQP